MRKTLRKLQVDGDFINPIKSIYKKQTAHVALSGELLKLPEIFCMRQAPASSQARPRGDCSRTKGFSRTIRYRLLSAFPQTSTNTEKVKSLRDTITTTPK